MVNVTCLCGHRSKSETPCRIEKVNDFFGLTSLCSHLPVLGLGPRLGELAS